eukprot:CAMPEP_0178924690 /NCGR_PEP_ID=MMETSP0786-20121207/17468_1 /TAXON_ID=186022 /ORGANISM="Thalassionema frauenfeldii, Strain CCMP 1798" /LENGTH=189 /DNA_ID=CAMNT_0020599431 /DNA_START=31 /DNA_END=600 /DNA_ORIENTATION=+
MMISNCFFVLAQLLLISGTKAQTRGGFQLSDTVANNNRGNSGIDFDFGKYGGSISGGKPDFGSRPDFGSFGGGGSMTRPDFVNIGSRPNFDGIYGGMKFPVFGDGGNSMIQQPPGGGSPSCRSGPDGPWPECRGIDGDDCCNLVIHTCNPTLECYVIPEGSAVTMDYREDRVRVFVNGQNKVQGEPNRG